MSLVSRFVVLIESRRLYRAAVATVTSISLLLSGLGLTAAHARPQGHDKAIKIARDLDDEAANFGAPKARWSRDVNGVRQVQAVVVSNSTDPSRAAQRSDVVSVSPNRVTTRTASTLESITRALASNVRTGSTRTSYSGNDGKNIGIAILDSGVMLSNAGLKNAGNGTHIKASASMLGTTQASWTTGVNSMAWCSAKAWC